MRAEPPDAQANLPQSYENPWGLLARDLRAVVADLGLQLRALWRRNLQGDLSVPGFWPGPLQALFWPLLLALLLALLLTLPWIGWSLLTRGPGSRGAELTVPAPMVQTPAGSKALQQRPDAAAPGSGDALPRTSAPAASSAPPESLPASTAGEASVPGAEPAPGGRDQAYGGGSVTSALPAPVRAPGEADAAAEGAVAAPLALDPLLQMLAEADPDHLIVSAHPEPALSLLRLTLAPGFAELPVARRSQWAELWCERAQELGYENFELVDGLQRPLGRKALVGSGMILLDPVPRQ